PARRCRTGAAQDQIDAVRATEIRLKRAEKLLDIAFDDGTHFSLPAELLRVESPSAEVQGHPPEQRQLVPVGNYAIRIVFDDGHDTGLYTWSYLHELGRDRPLRWKRYLDAMNKAGLSRD